MWKSCKVCEFCILLYYARKSDNQISNVIITLSRVIYKSIQNSQTSHDCIFHILQCSKMFCERWFCFDCLEQNVLNDSSKSLKPFLIPCIGRFCKFTHGPTHASINCAQWKMRQLYGSRVALNKHHFLLKFYSLLNTYHTCTQLKKITFSPSRFCAQAISELEDKKAPPPWKHKLTFENIFFC